MTEDWRAVPHYEGFYEASLALSAVRSLDRVIVDGRGQRRCLRGKRMYPTSTHAGHIVLSRDGHSLYTTISDVLAVTFATVAA